jgi:hypothetical protein
MASDPSAHRRRGTPISDSLGADLNTLGSILASHTRGLDDYLQRQAQRVEQRQGRLLDKTKALLFAPDLNLEVMTAKGLQNLCRLNKLKGWSKLKRGELIAFLKQKLGAECKPSVNLSQEGEDPPSAYPPDANRTERLLLLLLRHLNTPPAEVTEAWDGGTKAT